MLWLVKLINGLGFVPNLYSYIFIKRFEKFYNYMNEKKILKLIF